MPSIWEKPLATSLAFLRPSNIMLNTYWFLMTLWPFGGSTNSWTLCLQSESSCLQHALHHFSCLSLGILRMSLKVHSQILKVSGGLRSCSGTALASRRSWYLTPPSWVRQASICWSTLSSEGCRLSPIALGGSGSDCSGKLPGTGWSGEKGLQELLGFFITKHCQV